MRSGTYFVATCSRRAHVRIIPVLSAVRHHRMVEAATFLAANVSLVIGSRNGKTAGRLDSSTLLRIVLFRRAPFCVWKCWSILPPPSLSLSPTRISRSDVYLALFRFIRLRAIWSSVHLPVHLSVRSYIRSVVGQIRTYIHSSWCPLFYYFTTIFFARIVSPRNFSFFSRFADAHSGMIPDSWFPRKRAITILHF